MRPAGELENCAARSADREAQEQGAGEEGVLARGGEAHLSRQALPHEPVGGHPERGLA